MRLLDPQAIEQRLRRRARVPATAVRLAERLGARRVAATGGDLVFFISACLPLCGFLAFTVMEALGLAAAGKGMFVAGLVGSAWSLLARFMARWLVLDAEQIQWIGQVMRDEKHAAWNEIVAGWMLERPLVMSDYHALKRAKKALQQWAEAQEKEKGRQAATAYLMSSPVGSIVEQKRLERDTAPAQGQVKPPARL